MVRVLFFLVTLALLFLALDTTGSSGVVRAQKKPKKSTYERSVASCNRCHPKFVEEWEQSGHARAWTNPVFQAEIAEREDKGEACARCHAPDRVVPIGYIKEPKNDEEKEKNEKLLTANIGQAPKARFDSRDLGVTCLTCHVDDKKYFGPLPSNHHNGVIVLDEYRDPNWCKSCHGHPDISEHDHYTSYEAAPERKNQTCQTCHMPEVNRRMWHAKRKQKNDSGPQDCRQHIFDPVASVKSLEMTAESAEKISAKVVPHGGHSILVGSGKVLELSVEYLGEDGKSVATEKQVFKAGEDHDLLRARPQTLELEWKAAAKKARLTMELVALKVPGRDEEKREVLATAEVER